MTLLSRRARIALQIEAALRYSGDFSFARRADSRPAGLNSQINSIDFCLLDLEKANAAHEFNQLHRRYPEEWIVLLLEKGHEELAVQLLLDGADGCIDLESGADLVCACLREVAQGGTPLPASIATKVLHCARAARRNTGGCEKLSRREMQIVELLAQGALYKQIADSLGISLDTVRRHITNIYRKLDVRSRTEAVVKCFSMLAKHS